MTIGSGIRASLLLLLLGAWIGGASAGERMPEFTRADLVTALERAPGPAKGAAAAPIVMVDFSDFQCGYCRKYQKETIPKLDQHYVQSGKVRYVFRHLAILGEASVQAAQASACAFDQGKFWEYHDALFNSSGPLAFTVARLKQQAANLKLDANAFQVCFDTRKFAKVVETETLLGRALGATGTPAFLIKGQFIMGAYPFEAFQRFLDEQLAEPGGSPGKPAR
jgi:protein-disulfide isomerase